MSEKKLTKNTSGNIAAGVAMAASIVPLVKPAIDAVRAASDGRTLTKTFSDGFLTMTNVLKSAAGAEVARAVKTFDSDGKLISTVVTYS